jgi:hypothetical protein
MNFRIKLIVFELFSILFSTYSIEANNTNISESVAIIDYKLENHIKFDHIIIEELKRNHSVIKRKNLFIEIIGNIKTFTSYLYTLLQKLILNI